MLVDAHCHAYALREEELNEYEPKMLIISVAEDLESSVKTVNLTEKFLNIIPFVGIHPWKVGKIAQQEIEDALQLIEKEDEVKGIGEVGLDKLIAETYERQKEVFKKFCELASEYDLPMNIHARAAWRDALEILRRWDVESAVLHWYSGPIELLEEVEAGGYMITVNPALKIQPKHKKVLEQASLSMILTESDGPYEYRGLKLRPNLIPDLVKFIAEVKGLTPGDVEEAVESNLRRLLR